MFDATLVDLSNVFERQNVINKSLIENEHLIEGGDENFNNFKNRELNFNEENNP